MFKEGEEVLTFRMGGGANFKAAFLLACNEKVYVKKTFLGSMFPYFFYIPLTLTFCKISYEFFIMEEYKLIVVCFVFYSFLASFFIFIFRKSRVKKEFDFESGYYKEGGKKLVRIEDISQFLVISHYCSSSSGSPYTAFQFGFYCKENKGYVLMDHSNYSSIKRDVQMISERLNVPYEILNEHDKYKPNPIRAF